MKLFGRKKKKSFDNIKNTINPFAQDAFHLIETYDRTGFSKIGSTPVMPEGFEWPSQNGKSLSFLMQLKFSEINAEGQIPHLPKSGLLYVFNDQEQSTWGFDPNDKGSWKILFFPETDELKFKRYPKDMDVRYKEKMLTSKIIKTYPSYEDERIENLNFTDEQDDWYSEYKNSFFNNCPAHQIGGYPEPIQSPDMDLDCELASNGLYCGDETGYNDPRAKTLEKNRNEWTLLLQIDADDDAEMMWGDCGMLYFWIKKKDLAALNFDDVWMILQCG